MSAFTAIGSVRVCRSSGQTKKRHLVGRKQERLASAQYDFTRELLDIAVGLSLTAEKRLMFSPILAALRSLLQRSGIETAYVEQMVRGKTDLRRVSTMISRTENK